MDGHRFCQEKNSEGGRDGSTTASSPDIHGQRLVDATDWEIDPEKVWEEWQGSCRIAEGATAQWQETACWQKGPFSSLFRSVSHSPSNPLLEILVATIGRDAFSSLPFTFTSLFLRYRLSAPFLFFPFAGFSLLTAPISTMTRPSRCAPIHTSLQPATILYAHLCSSHRRI